MAKKTLDFTNPLISADPEERKNEPTTEKKRTRGKPRKDDIIRNEDGGNSKQEGLTAEYSRFSVIAKVANIEDLKNYAYTKRLTIRDALDEILETFFDEYRADPSNEKMLDRNGGKK